MCGEIIVSTLGAKVGESNASGDGKEEIKISSVSASGEIKPTIANGAIKPTTIRSCEPAMVLKQLIKDASDRSARMRHRGPNHTGSHPSKYFFMSHERLSIVGSESGAQPLHNETGSLVLGANGEIYNYEKIKATGLTSEHKFATGSDCEIILHLAEDYGTVEMLDKLRGMFAFILADDETGEWIAARDHVGIIPLCYGFDVNGNVWIASEMLAIHDVCIEIYDLEPGHYITSELLTPGCDVSKSLIQKKWYNPVWHNSIIFAPSLVDYDKLMMDDLVDKKDEKRIDVVGSENRESFQAKLVRYNKRYQKMCEAVKPVTMKLRTMMLETVKSHLMSDEQTRFACFNSGGLDSSIIFFCIGENCRRMKEVDGKSRELHGFSIGLGTSISTESKSTIISSSVDTECKSSTGVSSVTIEPTGDKDKDGKCVLVCKPSTMLSIGPDLPFARRMAEHVGGLYHEVLFTEETGYAIKDDVLRHLQTYDRTTLRASVPMYLLSRVVRDGGFKFIFSGEGSDELFGGYLYFHKCPSPSEMQAELVRKVTGLHKLDCLRANKSPAAWSLESRVPFLDRDFIEYVMTEISPYEKMCGRYITSSDIFPELDVPEDLFKTSDGKLDQVAIARFNSDIECAYILSSKGTTDKLYACPKRVMEKWILRKAFECDLPSEVVWRQKEQFSDSVGFNFINKLKEFSEARISDEKFSRAAERFPYNTPMTKEDYDNRERFERLFPSEACAKLTPGGASVACSSSHIMHWDKSFSQFADHSGRSIVGVHNSAYSEDYRRSEKAKELTKLT